MTSADIAALIEPEALRQRADSLDARANQDAVRFGGAGYYSAGDADFDRSTGKLLRQAASALAAQQAEIERLRARLECDGTNMGTGERQSVEPYDGIAVRDVMIADLRADLAARDETIRGLRERVRRLAHLANTGDSPKARAERAAERARTTLNSTEPFDD